MECWGAARTASNALHPCSADWFRLLLRAVVASRSDGGCHVSRLDVRGGACGPITGSLLLCCGEVGLCLNPARLADVGSMESFAHNLPRGDEQAIPRGSIRSNELQRRSLVIFLFAVPLVLCPLLSARPARPLGQGPSMRHTRTFGHSTCRMVWLSLSISLDLLLACALEIKLRQLVPCACTACL